MCFINLSKQSPQLHCDITSPQMVSAFPQPITGTMAKFEPPSTMTVSVNVPGSPKKGPHHLSTTKAAQPAENGQLTSSADAVSNAKSGSTSSADSSKGFEQLFRTEEKKLCRAIQNYVPKSSSELQLTKGDLVEGKATGGFSLAC